MSKTIKIDTAQEFPHLPGAPIVEAAVHWQAAPADPLEPKALHQTLQERLPEYPEIAPQVEVKVEHHVGPEGSRSSQSHAWQAFQIGRQDEPYVAQFRKNGLVVSRLKPYERWTTFRDEALRLWAVYNEIAAPPEIQRIGLRYINLVPVESLASANEYLRKPPEFPGDPIGSGLPLAQFTHQSRFDIPGHELQLNLVETVQPSPPGSKCELNLIVDFDIFSTGNRVPLDEFRSGSVFETMRWLKNKAFFSIFSDKAISQFKE